MGKKESHKEYGGTYTKNVFRITLLASITISLAVIITGILGYSNTKTSIIHKAKSQDIVFIVKSMAAKVDSRMNRAIETSYIFARDPLNIEWVKGEEKDEELGKSVLRKLEDITYAYDYSNLFIAGVKTRRFYFMENSVESKNRESNVILSETNPADKWFYDTLTAKKEISLNVNYDRVMDDSFLFVNVLMGGVDNPVGVCGVGLSLEDLSNEFRAFKVGEESSLWMTDEKGVIQLSDKREDIGKLYRKFLPESVNKQMQGDISEMVGSVKVSQYSDANNKIIDYAYCKLSSSDWILFYKIPRKESMALISSLRTNMILNVILVLLCFMILFYIISKKIADPYQQAILMNRELEHQVNIRTQELKDSNQKIIDSIEYAKRLQESILPSEQDLERVFKDHFIIWRPRDRVGGDFFWLREIDDRIVLAVGDCTGHGVPGALMTMTVNAILHNIVMSVNKDDPSIILRELHMQLKQTLNKTEHAQMMDDGLDIAIFCIKNKSNLLYSGGNIDLYIKNDKEIRLIKAQSKGVGYSYIEIQDSLCSERIVAQEGDIFVVTTDGFIHQNGGHKNYPFGKKRLYNMIQECQDADFNLMKVKFEAELKAYMKTEIQRDDITMLAFKIK